jgi:hypothetical protein
MKEDEVALTLNTLPREHCMHIRQKDWRKGHVEDLDVDGNAFEMRVFSGGAF